MSDARYPDGTFIEPLPGGIVERLNNKRGLNPDGTPNTSPPGGKVAFAEQSVTAKLAAQQKMLQQRRRFPSLG
jgi:hypothetical protein